ncbi:hypothetical protein [Anaerospora hongkongensis]|uniref:hypothetical protein n=1 Tax=Anaerospora hongkongensis TaxID=244830 RepID=UPI00289ABEF1|nr:hypothetical protein [Anaerospora hongkongensis]
MHNRIVEKPVALATGFSLDTGGRFSCIIAQQLYDKRGGLASPCLQTENDTGGRFLCIIAQQVYDELGRACLALLAGEESLEDTMA